MVISFTINETLTNLEQAILASITSNPDADLYFSFDADYTSVEVNISEARESINGKN